jgi:hypothetical protein
MCGWSPSKFEAKGSQGGEDSIDDSALMLNRHIKLGRSLQEMAALILERYKKSVDYTNLALCMDAAMDLARNGIKIEVDAMCILTESCQLKGQPNDAEENGS